MKAIRVVVLVLLSVGHTMLTSATPLPPCTTWDTIKLMPKISRCGAIIGRPSTRSLWDVITTDIKALCANDVCQALLHAINELKCSVDPSGRMVNGDVRCNSTAWLPGAATTVPNATLVYATISPKFHSRRPSPLPVVVGHQPSQHRPDCNPTSRSHRNVTANITWAQAPLPFHQPSNTTLGKMNEAFDITSDSPVCCVGGVDASAVATVVLALLASPWM
ncbi:hypothetical protein H310_11449 [Aphanomyces invadans]|uniref:Elicitin n=1 Tax=Aphanomyces invadans TaxID=157072 RepID=A0A024TP90_9STRA|nr:hypothetical protein H310_11449 [Aphanomyces invadans]ETV95187.1 hypothetical protein H310_11449 [Aphanomyces invadans]|eukprot:XP_008876360.1 hypothetical protein H310_11449 [Aphanomyces invadans]